MRAVRFRQAHGLPLKPLNSRHWIFYICSNWFSPLPTSFRDGCPREYAICSIAFPLIKPTILQQKTLWSSEPSRSIPSLNASGSQRIHQPTVTFSRSGYQIEAERNTAARAKGTWTSYTESEFVLCALADNDDESDDDLPFLEEQSRATLRPKISTEASNAGSPPFSVSNSQLFTAPDCKSTEHNHGQVNVRVVVEAGAPAVPHAQKRSANYMQINQ